MPLLNKFIENIKQLNLFSPKDRLILAVSGGVDSVVLCELCRQAGFNFIIAHCNFQLRGEESERDEQFVRKLGEKYGVETLVKKFETEKYALEQKNSIQEAARWLRYKWFFDLENERFYEEPADSTGTKVDTVPGWQAPHTFSFVLTAHHADDNAETVLMNFCRGTGLHGLTGIPATGTFFMMPFIKRPLLVFSKDEILQFAAENNLEYVEDSSNLASKYTRNFFRNEIIPAISKVYPQVKENLLKNIERFKEIEKLYQLSVGEIKQKLCKQKGEELHIPIKQLLGYRNSALIYEIISPYGFSEGQVDEVIKLGAGDSGSYINSSDEQHRIIKHRHWFIITTAIGPFGENIVIEENETVRLFPGGRLEFKLTANLQPSPGPGTAYLDAGEIKFPLLLRRWKTGDYFYPLGMRKKKKVARFLIDQKLSKPAKEKTWVLEMNKKILWVVGQRIDDRFRITDNTKKVLQVDFYPED